MKIIRWRSKATGYTGHGQPIADEIAAQHICDAMNATYPMLEHTCVDAGEEEVQ